MAVDFSQLPVEQPMPNDAPSPLIWTIVFFALTLLGVFAVILLWPKDLATVTPMFWATITALPGLCASLVVLRRYSAYEGDKVNIAEHNEAVHTFNQRVFVAASHPLALVATAFRFSAEKEENSIAGVRTGKLKLIAKSTPRDEEAIQARWIVAPDVPLTLGNKDADLERQRRAVKWLYSELLGDLSGAIYGLPIGIELEVQFAISSLLTIEERDTLWKNVCKKHALPNMTISAVEMPIDLHSLDSWLDDLIDTSDQRLRLVVAIQLHPLLSDTPPEGSAEAAVALLLMPDSLARHHGIDHQAKLHRPVRSTLGNAHDALMPALKWAGASGGEIADSWQTGFNDTTKGHLINPLNAFGVTRKPINLDGSVGYAGVAAPWLAVACASAALSEERPIQMVLSGTPENVDCAVLRRPLANQPWA